MEKEFTTTSPDETIARGKEFVASLEAGEVVCLQGDLGAGKTHFVKGMAEGLGIESDDVSSPTFTLINEYDGDKLLYHFDCYRMESPREALEIGAEEYFYGDGVTVIEWPERIEPLIPPEAIWISIEAPDKNTRKFVIRKREP
ncbi:tRNA (adenosine(37)-N6)-threonylcarbamoyltransferase complex ATPase subunit type 1 TsaE [Aliifodinibius salipaludis]|uniref:tRNA threonylcarbamoyladenosine biosynthesis protein TsaE n=1 Tax=Fodinibius salipaludis TaxID=2032627 RepID=A0A2A2GE77_9BACT|nr:tRNA (adenosine(37)-N6)-threonylcarbamoyltransferase complex ATPase subunit type 1 TsaE [Aliifodinibius salipaludis]PAU95179.1 tRNA (adenosine(37)-N6)-threonylcarbamoyltransferase complex ATPase subunit type 1 TsaE [Aliifodinibius salipaludis]